MIDKEVSDSKASSSGRNRTGRLGQILLIFNALTQTCIALFTAPFRGSNGSRNYFRHVIYTGFRTLFSGGYLVPGSTTDQEHSNFVKSYKIKSRTIGLKDGTKGHWMGDESAKKTVVFFHGGGYVLPASRPHYYFCWKLIEAAREKGKSLRVLFASFELSPKVRYPHHLAAAVNLIQHLIDVENVSPSDIILLGDSSGGHMLLGILAHALHPHPSISPLSLPSPIGTAIAHSPKVSASRLRTADSITRNKYKDFSSIGGLKKVNEEYLGPDGVPDSWNSWLKADATVYENWWDGLEKVVDSVLVTAGSDELYVDDIVEVGEDIKKAHKNAVLFVGPDEAHDACMMDYALGWTGKSESPEVIMDWVLKDL